MLVEYSDRDSLAPEASCERLKASCLLASHLLWPAYVRDLALYWLANYSNYTEVEREEDMFNELVRQLLTQRPRLRLHVGEHMIHRSCNTYFYPSYVQLVGGGRHAVPMEYAQRQHYASLHAALSQLVQPAMEAFTQCVPVGLNGELELGGFVHDAVLECFYEPSFVITTLYMFHLVALLTVTESREPADWLPRHYYALRAIEEPALREACCLADANRMDEMRRELRELHDALNTSQAQQALRDVRALWERKATYCWSEIFVRIAAFLRSVAQER
jgi:hypothetical protein